MTDLFQVKLPEDAKVTRPPFTRPGIEQSYYDVADPAMRNASLPLPALTAWVTLDYDGVEVKLGQEVQTLHRVTGQGTVYEPLVVAPAISVAVSPSAGVVPLTEKTLMVSAKVKSNVKGAATGTVKLELPKGWTEVAGEGGVFAGEGWGFGGCAVCGDSGEDGREGLYDDGGGELRRARSIARGIRRLGMRDCCRRIFIGRRRIGRGGRM